MKTAVVFGASGLIGAACVNALHLQGYKVTGVGRSRKTAAQTSVATHWVSCNLAGASGYDLAQIIDGCDVIVNAAGALQEGSKDSLRAIHVDFIARLINCLAGKETRLVHISAVGVSSSADTEFLRTKAEADSLLTASGLNAVILRPSLVLAPEAYGGTALLRALAAMPWIGPKVFADTQMHVIGIDDLTSAVVSAARGEGGVGTYDLTASGVISFDDLSLRMRRWLGFAPWKRRMGVPPILVKMIGRVADGFGWLGWRSPLRSSAIRVMASGVQGDGTAWQDTTGQTMAELEDILRRMPATVQERSYARLYLLLPAIIGVLSLFWLVSGIMGLARFDAATSVLASGVLSGVWGATFVGFGALVDICLGLAILHRKTCRMASLGMFSTACAYMIGGALFVPELWLDPLGPMVKVFPAAALSLLPALLLEER